MIRSTPPSTASRRASSARVEVRSLDSSVNPYLAYALILAAGLSGIENEMELPDPTEDDVWSLTERQREALGIKPLPVGLDDAVRAMEDSQLVADTLGEHVFDFVLRNKKQEWNDYRHQVTPFELEHLLPRL